MNEISNRLYSTRLIVLLSSFVLFSFFAKTQLNLVPNPGFEIYDTCPQDLFNPPYSGTNAICRAIPWFQPNSPGITCSGSTDFFHACSSFVPQNILGFQYARTGSGYAGAGIAYVPGAGGGWGIP
jgi:hypothetical protein